MHIMIPPSLIPTPPLMRDWGTILYDVHSAKLLMKEYR